MSCERRAEGCDYVGAQSILPTEKFLEERLKGKKGPGSITLFAGNIGLICLRMDVF